MDYSNNLADSVRMTLVLFRRRALGEQCGAEQRLGRAFEKAVRRKPLARRTLRVYTSDTPVES